MAALLTVILCCQLTDWALTLDGIVCGLVTEANPFMAPFVEAGPLPALAVKLALVLPILATLFLLRGHRLIRGTAWVVCGMSVGVVCWHVLGRIVFL